MYMAWNRIDFDSDFLGKGVWDEGRAVNYFPSGDSVVI